MHTLIENVLPHAINIILYKFIKISLSISYIFICLINSTMSFCNENIRKISHKNFHFTTSIQLTHKISCKIIKRYKFIFSNHLYFSYTIDVLFKIVSKISNITSYIQYIMLNMYHCREQTQPPGR